MIPIITLSWPEDYDDPLAEQLASSLEEKFSVKIERTAHQGLWAAFEWAIPTQFIIFIAGSFFGSVVAEIGKDAYENAKSGIKKYIAEKREMKTRLIVASSSSEKLSKNYDQSLTISLKVKLHPRILITVLVNETVDEKDLDDMFEGMFQTLAVLYEECREDDEKGGHAFGGPPERLYLLADVAKRQWDIFTEKQMREKYSG